MKIGIIPARFGSTRFPGKPLALISGKPMIQYVYESAVASACFDNVYIATDDERIYQKATGFGAEVVMTSSTLQSGTDRVYEAVNKLESEKKISNIEVIVNIQGDEPLCPPSLFKELISTFNQSDSPICTPIAIITTEDEYRNPNIVKVVVNSVQNALYFSRSSIPYMKEFSLRTPLYKHIGLYAYSREVLEFFANAQTSSLELHESLEQLRLLEKGFSIQCFETSYSSYAVDVPEDIEKIENLISQDSI